MEIWAMTPIQAEMAVMLYYTEEQQNERESRLRESDKQYLFSFCLWYQDEMYISSLPASTSRQQGWEQKNYEKNSTKKIEK